MVTINDAAKAFAAALAVTRGWGYNDLAVFAHAWHETDGFTSCPGHNYWGLKVPQKRPWNGLRQKLKTKEELIKGVKTPVYDWFVAFATVEAALVYYATFIAGNYGDAYMYRADPFKYFEHLVDKIPDFKGDSDLQFATDSDYYPLLCKRYNMLAADAGVRQLLGLSV